MTHIEKIKKYLYKLQNYNSNSSKNSIYLSKINYYYEQYGGKGDKTTKKSVASTITQIPQIVACDLTKITNNIIINIAKKDILVLISGTGVTITATILDNLITSVFKSNKCDPKKEYIIGNGKIVMHVDINNKGGKYIALTPSAQNSLIEISLESYNTLKRKFITQHAHIQIDSKQVQHKDTDVLNNDAIIALFYLWAVKLGNMWDHNNIHIFNTIKTELNLS